MSLDQCADQYVLALSPRSAIAALSTRARNPDSYLRAQAAGLPEKRATIESVSRRSWFATGAATDACWLT
jgi:iron complex transport system substrate-binding protein